MSKAMIIALAAVAMAEPFLPDAVVGLISVVMAVAGAVVSVFLVLHASR